MPAVEVVKDKPSEHRYNLGDKVIFENETCTVIAVEDGGSTIVTPQVTKIMGNEVVGHEQRLRLRDSHGQERYPISGANVKPIKKES